MPPAPKAAPSFVAVDGISPAQTVEGSSSGRRPKTAFLHEADRMRATRETSPAERARDPSEPRETSPAHEGPPSFEVPPAPLADLAGWDVEEQTNPRTPARIGKTLLRYIANIVIPTVLTLDEFNSKQSYTSTTLPPAITQNASHAP